MKRALCLEGCMNVARAEILQKLRSALGRDADTPAPPAPETTRVPSRPAGDRAGEASLLLAEIEKVGGRTRRIAGAGELAAALAELVRAEGIRKAALWSTPELRELGVGESLAALGVEVVPAGAGKEALADCDLGVTGADGALPETGTLLLRSTPDRPRLVSLLPRVHLAIVRPSALRADLAEAFDDVKGEAYFVFVTGPSRTSDIELTLAIGVHGPKALHVWLLSDAA